MQQTYDTIQQYIIDLINKYRYQHFNGPLTASNVSTLVELSKSRDPSKTYDVLNKSDMEVRINYLEIMKYLANPYVINNKKLDCSYSLFKWDDYKVFNVYRQLKEKDKQKFWKQLLKDDIYFECLSPDILLLGFKLDKKYAYPRQ
jgi:hypothetical protein